MLASALGGCQSSLQDDHGSAQDGAPSALAQSADAPQQGAASGFSAERAWAHLEALVALGPRVTGTAGAASARDYLREQLVAIGALVVEQRFEAIGVEGEPLEIVHLTGVLPGASSDVFLLAAAYDTTPFDTFRFVGANDGASGPALLLELGRVLADRPRRYTVWLTFLDGDSMHEARVATQGAEDRAFAGSRALARQLADEGRLSRIRLAVYYNQVADRDLSIERDLRSHRIYREIFWQSARSLDQTAAFPENGHFGSPLTGHRSFLDHGVRRVVAIMDDRYGGSEPPGVHWHSEEDTLRQCSPASLASVGVVSLEALQRIETRLAKIDRFVGPREETGRDGGTAD